MGSSARAPQGGTLSDGIADDLRRRLGQAEWEIGARLPTEHELAAQYEVSRATVRTALKELEGRGLTVTVHGLGTFVTAATRVVSADLQRLESISETILRMGRVPSSRFRAIVVRDATDHERTALALPPHAMVLAIHCEILADGEVVAYSRDVIPTDVLGSGFDLRSVDGSLFTILEARDVDVRSSLTSIHASGGEDIGWGDHPDGALYVLLEQAHFDVRGQGVAFSRTWFTEGRFQFSIVRTR